MVLGRRLKIQKTVSNNYLLTETYIFEKRKNRSSLRKHYDHKLDNSISRARSSIFNIVYFNKFSYFYTQTVSSKYNRSDLKLLVSKFANITRNLRKLYKDKDFYYLIIPEYHRDNKCFHLHGFLSKDYDVDLYINRNGFPSLKHFDAIGFNSISKIRNYDACLKYSGAYISKNLCHDRLIGERLFYCSQGLNRDNTIDIKEASSFMPISYDFKNEFCCKTTLDENKYYNLITKLDNNNRFYYY